MTQPFFAVQGLRKSFAGTEVLHGVNLSLAKSDILTLVGPSGAGKTTVLRALDFLDSVDAGTITFAGQTIEMARASSRTIREFRRRTAFVFQNFNLFLNKTARENITLGLVHAQGVGKEQAQDIATGLLEKVGLLAHGDKYPSELSGGQQQRIAIARALAPNPDLMFLDEPTSALDPEHTKEVVDLLKVLAQEGRTMIIVTHALAFAQEIDTQAALLENGAIVETGPSTQFFSQPRNERTRAFLAGKNE